MNKKVFSPVDNGIIQGLTEVIQDANNEKSFIYEEAEGLYSEKVDLALTPSAYLKSSLFNTCSGYVQCAGR